jgi:glutamate-1-semialdehyde 2,1-aminomutase
MTTARTEAASRLTSEYQERFPGSASLYERARHLMPSGINHDVRRIDPFPVYIDRAVGAYKWDVDDHRFIDYCVGHGALILGHSHPDVLAAMQMQVSKVTHASAPTPQEVRWAELITEMVPSAERVRFVLSGTEATLLAIRLVRAASGRDILVRINGHFHGWHDTAMIHWLPPYERPSSAGVAADIGRGVRSVPLHDLEALERALAPGDVAGVILEPDGPVVGTVPVPDGYLHGVREVTRRYGVALIFDEVVTGFRLAPGGAQQHFGVIPDVTTFAKAIAGGAPSGAVAGRADIMEHISYTGDPEHDRFERVAHMGTYSAHPVAAAAGVAALEHLRDGSVQDLTADLADRLRAGLDHEMHRRGIRGCAYGRRSCFRVIVGDDDDLPATGDRDEFLRTIQTGRLMEGTRRALRSALHKANLLEGIDFIAGNHGWLSAAHTVADIDETVAAFGRSLDRAMQDGDLSPSWSGVDAAGVVQP